MYPKSAAKQKRKKLASSHTTLLFGIFRRRGMNNRRKVGKLSWPAYFLFFWYGFLSTKSHTFGVRKKSQLTSQKTVDQPPTKMSQMDPELRLQMQASILNGGKPTGIFVEIIWHEFLMKKLFFGVKKHLGCQFRNKKHVPVQKWPTHFKENLKRYNLPKGLILKPYFKQFPTRLKFR